MSKYLIYDILDGCDHYYEPGMDDQFYKQIEKILMFSMLAYKWNWYRVGEHNYNALIYKVIRI